MAEDFPLTPLVQANDRNSLEEEFVRELNRHPDFFAARWSLPRSLTQNLAVLPGPCATVHGRDARGRQWTLLLAKSSSTYPRDVREAAVGLAEALRQRTAETNEIQYSGVLLAEALSHQVRRNLREAGLGYFDATGSLFLTSDCLLMHRDLPPPKSVSGLPRTRASGPAREAIVHSWLRLANEWVGLPQLAQMAQTSVPTVRRTAAWLERMEWIEIRTGCGEYSYRLTQPAQLLDAWIEERRRRRDPYTRWFRFAHRHEYLIPAIAANVAAHSLDWVLTGQGGANLLTPHLTGTSELAFSVPRGTAEHAARLMGLQPAAVGGNIDLIERTGPADFLFKERLPQYENLSIASRLVLYADLVTRGRGRDPELAAHLRRHCIGY